MSRPAWRPSPAKAYKARDRKVTSGMMSAVRGRENKAEVSLRKALWRLGYRYRLQSNSLTGRPDIVLPKHRAVIFVDGDFWHGRALREGGEAQLRQLVRGDRFDWWRDKFARNIMRDDRVTAELRADGWAVLRVWESDINTNLGGVLASVVEALHPNRNLRG